MLKSSWISAFFCVLVVGTVFKIYGTTGNSGGTITFVLQQIPGNLYKQSSEIPIHQKAANIQPLSSQNILSIQTPQPTEVHGCSGCDDIEKERASMFLTATAKEKQNITPSPTASNSKVVIYLFWGDGCPHCEKAKPFFERLANTNPAIELRMFEVWYDLKNQELFTKMGTMYGMTARYVPTYYIGNQFWEGYHDSLNAEIREAINQCLRDGCPNYGAAILQGNPPIPIPSPTPLRLPPQLPAPATQSAQWIPPSSSPQQQPPSTEPSLKNSIDIPWLGTIDLTQSPLFITTLIVAFVDGFNPCSIWVLSILLAIALHSGSRKKVFIIGLVFITVTALIYALFIGGLFTAFTFIRYIGWIQVVTALVALIFGLINIKDYFWYKQGISFTIDERQKPGLYNRIRKLALREESWVGLIFGTIILAGGVSLIEFSCTAGFPIIWTNILTSHQVSWLTFGILLLVYLIIYQIDELGLFLIAVTTLRAAKITEKHGRTLKLIGGVLMLTLAGGMLINPQIMNNLFGSLLVFGFAFFISIGILLVHQRIVERINIKE